MNEADTKRLEAAREWDFIDDPEIPEHIRTSLAVAGRHIDVLLRLLDDQQRELEEAASAARDLETWCIEANKTAEPTPALRKAFAFYKEHFPHDH